MILQMTLRYELRITNAALEIPFIQVRFHINLQVSLLSKAFSTIFALIGFNPQVLPLMYFQPLLLTVTYPTIGAFIRFFLLVIEHMRLQVSLRNE